MGNISSVPALGEDAAKALLPVGLVQFGVGMMMLVDAVAVGQLRFITDTPAPAMTGPPIFQRAVRAQLNNVEQGLPFTGALWAHALLVSPSTAAIGGSVWLACRVMYAMAYRSDWLHGQRQLTMLTQPSYMAVAFLGYGAVFKALSTYTGCSPTQAVLGCVGVHALLMAGIVSYPYALYSQASAEGAAIAKPWS